MIEIHMVKDVTFSQTSFLKNDWWNIESVSGDARFLAMVELGRVKDLTFILPHLNWFYLTLKTMGVLKETS